MSRVSPGESVTDVLPQTYLSQWYRIQNNDGAPMVAPRQMKRLYESITYVSAYQLADEDSIRCICTLGNIIKTPMKLFIKDACDTVDFGKLAGAGAGAGADDRSFACCLEGNHVEAKSLKQFKEMQKDKEKMQNFLVSGAQSLVFVDGPNNCFWVKPPIENPLALIKVDIDTIIPLSKDEFLKSIQNFESEKVPYLWVGAPYPRRSLGFVIIREEKAVDTGARFRPNKRVRVGDTPSARPLTKPAKSIFGEEPEVIEQTAPVSLRSQSFLQNMNTIPSFMESKMLPPEIAVHRIDMKHFPYHPGLSCGTFFYRVPISDIYLRIDSDPRKTMVYNSKSSAIIDIVFKDFRDGRFKGKTNSGVIFFWKHVLQYNRKKFAEENKIPYEEISPLSKANQERMDRFKNDYIARTLDRAKLQGSSLSEMHDLRKHLTDTFKSWESIIEFFVRLAFLYGIGGESYGNLLLPRSRLMWLKPFPVSLYFFHHQGRWRSQRMQHYPEITKNLNDLAKDKDVKVAAVIPKGLILPEEAYDNLEWANGNKNYLVHEIPGDEFHELVRKDNTTTFGSKFSKTYTEEQGKVSLLENGHDSGGMPKFGSLQNNDVGLCVIGQTLGYKTAIITTPWYGMDTPFTEIYDLRPREYENIIKWTGDKRLMEHFKKSKDM